MGTGCYEQGVQAKHDYSKTDAPASKQCSKCGEWKDRSEYSKQSRCKDGLQYYCKSCAAISNADYRANNHEKIMAQHAAYHAEHREEELAYRTEHKDERASANAAWYLKHREKQLAHNRVYYAEHRKDRTAHNRVYYAEHREKILAKHLSWASTNPDKMRAQQHRRRARIFGNGGTHTAQDIQRQGDSQKWKCWWRGPGCLVDCKDNYHIDHLIPLAKGGHNNPSNIVISCPHCNFSKQDKTPDEWIGRLL